MLRKIKLYKFLIVLGQGISVLSRHYLEHPYTTNVRDYAYLSFLDEFKQYPRDLPRKR